MMKKRLLGILLCCCIMLTLLPTAVFAAGSGTADPSEQSTSMSIHVVLPDTGVLTLEGLTSEDTVGDVKTKIQGEKGYAVTLQKLFATLDEVRTELQDDRTLSDYGIPADSTLTLELAYLVKLTDSAGTEAAYFDTLSDAFSAVPAKSDTDTVYTVKVLDSRQLDTDWISVSGKRVTLDLGGQTLSRCWIQLKNKAELTVAGSGALDGGSHIEVYANCSLYVKGGSIDLVSSKSVNAGNNGIVYLQGGTIGLTLRLKGDAVLTGGTLTGLSQHDFTAMGVADSVLLGDILPEGYALECADDPAEKLPRSTGIKKNDSLYDKTMRVVLCDHSGEDAMQNGRCVYCGVEDPSTFDLSDGSIEVTMDETGAQTVKQGEKTIAQTGAVTIMQSGSDTSTTQYGITVTAAAGQTANIILAGVNIDLRDTGSTREDSVGTAAMVTYGDGNVTVELDGVNCLISGVCRAGLEKHNAGMLTINDSNAMPGSLQAVGFVQSAGIGGNTGYRYGFEDERVTLANANAENITINGGTVTAIGQNKASGIGGGGFHTLYDENHKNNQFGEDETWGKNNPQRAAGCAENITINGGFITVQGGEYGADIGRSEFSFKGRVSTESGLTVTGGTFYRSIPANVEIQGHVVQYQVGVTVSAWQVLQNAGLAYLPRLVDENGVSLDEWYRENEKYNFADPVTAGLMLTAQAHTCDGWRSDENSHWHYCTDCDKILDKAAHIYGEWTEEVHPTTGKVDRKECVCSVCGYVQVWKIPTPDDPDHVCVYDQRLVSPAALKTTGSCMQSRVYYMSCFCGALSSTEIFTVSPSHYHRDVTGQYDIDVHWDTCMDCGMIRYINYPPTHHLKGSKCYDCDYDSAEHPEHTLYLVPAREPTCTENGNIAYYACTGCGGTYKNSDGTEFIPLFGEFKWNGTAPIEYGSGAIRLATGHSPVNDEWQKGENAHWRLCACGAVFDRGLHTYDDNSDTTCNTCGYVRTVAPTTSTVTFDANGGTIGSGNVTEYTYGEGAVLPTDVTRTGYTFDGWYDNAEFEGTAVTSISDTDSGNKTYYAKWTEKGNYIVIFNSNGGTAISDKKTVKWTDKVLDGVIDPTKDGYKFAGWKCVDRDVTSDTTYADLAENDADESVTLSARWLDVVNPTGEIKIAENGWRSILNGITFGLFFKDTQTVTITAADNSGETVSIEYLLSNRELIKGELAEMTFTAYSAPFNINPDNEYVIYAKLTDTSGNIAYINTNGIVLDATAPVISGIENEKAYCAAQTVTVTEKYIGTVTVNGTEVSLDENGQFVLSPASGKQTVSVTDKAGNKTVFTVTVNDGHTGGTATCKDKATCSVCGESYGGLNAHSYSPNWSSDGTKHWHECTVCGKKTDEAEHTDTNKDHKCDTCGKVLSECDDADKDHKCDICQKALSDHTGGTATCKERATCEICGESYGGLKAHSYSPNWSSDSTRHWHKCSVCGDKKDEASHGFGEWNEIKSATETEKGWKERICSACSYKETKDIPALGHTHAFGKEWRHDGINHWHECACGEKSDNAAHTGGTATCKEKAICSVCGEKYGELKAHSFTAENTDAKYLKTAATCTKQAVYYKSCAACGLSSEDTSDEATFQSGDVLGHNSGTWNSNDDGTHSKTCQNAGCTMSETESCSGGRADRHSKAICETCGESYGEPDSNNHADMKHIDTKAATKTNEGNIKYWYCEDCGKYFADEDGTKEITKADTVTEKLSEEKPTSPSTGDTSDLVLWIALLFISGGVVAATTIADKKRKHSR